MNKEVIKAMNRKPTPKKDNFRKWWEKNSYKVMRVIFFPLWLLAIALQKLENWLNSRNPWSNERADEVLSYYIPRVAKWDADTKSFYFFDNGMGWGAKCRTKYIKHKDRKWWYNHRGFNGGKIRYYLIFYFELEGFTKEVMDTGDGWTEISFTMNEKGA